MAATTTSALDLITGALRNINALEAGETPSAQDSGDALMVLNDLVESWSLDKLIIFSQVENVLALIPGQNQYTIGNPVGGTFTGTLVAGSPIISGVTIPTGLTLGGSLSDVQASIPSGATITAIGTSTVTMSVNALLTVSAAEVMTYTTPGNFAIARPLRILNAYTRITGSGTTSLDYQCEPIGRDKYTAIGLKNLPGPWPLVLYYDATYPTGNLYFYPSPSQGGMLHLWTDTILSDFATLNQAVNLPQGFARALKKNLALELAPEYGKSAGALLVKQAMDAKQAIRNLNSTPTVEAFFDTDLVRSNRRDAGWIMHGGFR